MDSDQILAGETSFTPYTCISQPHADEPSIDQSSLWLEEVLLIRCQRACFWHYTELQNYSIRRHRKNCESCSSSTQVTWKIKFMSDLFVLSDLSLLSVPCVLSVPMTMMTMLTITTLTTMTIMMIMTITTTMIIIIMTIITSEWIFNVGVEMTGQLKIMSKLHSGICCRCKFLPLEPAYNS